MGVPIHFGIQCFKPCFHFFEQAFLSLWNCQGCRSMKAVERNAELTTPVNSDAMLIKCQQTRQMELRSWPFSKETFCRGAYGKSGNPETDPEFGNGTGTRTRTGTAPGVNWETLKPVPWWNLPRYVIQDGVSSIISIWDTIRTLSNWETDLKKVSET